MFPTGRFPASPCRLFRCFRYAISVLTYPREVRSVKQLKREGEEIWPVQQADLNDSPPNR
jgi:hypothetical protein